MGTAIIIGDINFGATDLGKVTLSDYIPVTEVTIERPLLLIDGMTLNVRYTPFTTSQRHVVWSITEGSDIASIDLDGKIAIKADAENGVVKVKAEIAANPGVYDEVAIRYIKPMYLKNSGLEFIDIGVKPTSDMVIEYVADVESVVFGAPTLIGSRSASGSQQFAAMYGYSNVKQLVFRRGYDTSTPVPFKTGVHTYRFGENVEIDDELIYNFTPYVFTDNAKNIYVFGLNNNGTNEPFGGEARIREVKVYANGELIKYLLPNIVGGECGLTDVLTGEFYGNTSGAGSFTLEDVE